MVIQGLGDIPTRYFPSTFTIVLALFLGVCTNKEIAKKRVPSAETLTDEIAHRLAKLEGGWCTRPGALSFGASQGGRAFCKGSPGQG